MNEERMWFARTYLRRPAFGVVRRRIAYASCRSALGFKTNEKEGRRCRFG